jgi:predicted amidophosphoribosyltransferase
VRAWKERGLRHLAACAAELVVEHLERPAVDLITYVPSDPLRQLDRGRHPAESLARELGARWELDLVSLLERGRAAERQATLPYAERGSNVRGAFTARRPPAGNVVDTGVVRTRMLLVDDVYTTGSTVSAAASALRRQGVSTVEVVTFARAIRR